MALLQKAYLGATPLFRNTSFFEDNAYTRIASGNPTVTSGSPAHTKGAWTQLVASTSGNASVIYLSLSNFLNGGDSSMLLDIGIGASGSETVLIGNIACGGAHQGVNMSIGTYSFHFEIPIKIPSGSRISARSQCISASKTVRAGFTLFNVGDYDQAPTSVDSIGVNTATSEGTNFVANNTYVELTAATSRAYRAVVLIPNVSGSEVGSLSATFTVATGASGSEVEIGNRLAVYNNAEFVCCEQNMLIPQNIPSGTRLSVKANGLSGTIANYGASLIGIP
jgi:hypothetical protein